MADPCPMMQTPLGIALVECRSESIRFAAFSEAAPMLFPMYTVAVDVLLKMTRVEPHEKLKARSLVVETDVSLRFLSAPRLPLGP